MSLFDTDYNSASNDNSGDQDYEDRTSLKMSKYAFISFEISRLAYYESSRGLNAIVDIDDVKVLDGIVMDRGGDDDDTVKVFGWDTWFQTDENGKLDEEVEPDEVPTRHSEKFGVNDYSYTLEDAAWEGDDEPIDLGNLVMWLNNSTKNRTFLKVVTPHGHDIVNDKDDDYNWFYEDKLNLRDDLRGRRVILAYEKNTFKPDDADEDDDPVPYTDAKILDADTFAGITMVNSGDDNGTQGSLEDTTTEDADLSDGIPDELENIIGFMANTSETNPENVEQLVKGELNESHSMGDVDIGTVIDEIESRM